MRSTALVKGAPFEASHVLPHVVFFSGLDAIGFGKGD